MKIGIVGAGFAGLSSAKVLRQLGHDVVVWEKAPDVGGVWSDTRRYPGVRTQNDKGTYALSDLPMPADYPEWPSGAQVQAYLQTYAEQFDLVRHIQLGTEVLQARPSGAGGWDVETADATTHVDHLVLASGIFSRPFVPPMEDLRPVREAGRRGPGGQRAGTATTRSAARTSIVLGYGKSACDITVEIASVAASTTVVARELLWKMPRKIANAVNFKFLMLTRMGEGLFRYRSTSGPEKLLHARNSAMANSMLGSVEKVTTGQLKLDDLGLVPRGQFSDIARSTVSLATEGFFEGVAEGRIAVKRDTVVAGFVEYDGKAAGRAVHRRAGPGRRRRRGHRLDPGPAVPARGGPRPAHRRAR